MGFLAAGIPLPWEQSLQFIEYIRKHGVTQLLNTLARISKRANDKLLWGDELEYHIVQLDPSSRSVKLLLDAPRVIAELEATEDEDESLSAWRPEYGAWMIEGTPGRPYGGHTTDLRDVEFNLMVRRRRIMGALRPNQVPISLVAFPLMGVGSFSVPTAAAGGPHSRSRYVPDECISPHPRFGTLTANIRRRRGEKVSIYVPLFMDKHTDPEVDVKDGERALDRAQEALHTPIADIPASPSDAGGVCEVDDVECSDPLACAGPKAGFIHMDCMAFGMGCCCLQVTFQARNLLESRQLYDQLAVLSPLVMALTAASSIFKGKLADIDTRWEVIAASVDCRTPQERGSAAKPVGWQNLESAKFAAARGAQRIAKSRYDSIDSYLGGTKFFADKYNDIDLLVDSEVESAVLAAGIDPPLARHIAHLFIRDPLVIFSDRVEVDDEATTEHFENFQSTNWQSVRWKPPPADTDKIGWRVELRTMEAQMTDFENAAFTVFVALVSRVVLFFDLNLYIPMSKVDENMQRAKRRQAASEGKFHFRKYMVPLEGTDSIEGDIDEDVELTLDEILMGRGQNFPGLVPLIFAYLELIECDPQTLQTVEVYCDFIVARARGELQTNATYLREFVRNHPEYKQDSVVSEGIAYDLVTHVRDITSGRLNPPQLLGQYRRKMDELNPRCVTVLRSPDSVPDFKALAACQAGDDSRCTEGGSGRLPTPTADETADAFPDVGLSMDGTEPAGSPGLSIGLGVHAPPPAPAAPAADAAAKQDSPARGRPANRTHRGPRMRGASFAEELATAGSECVIIQRLVRSHHIKSSFADTAPFLPSPAAKP